MQKVLSPQPKSEYSPNWPALKANDSATGRLLEDELEGARVGRLVGDLGDRGEVRNVQMGGLRLGGAGDGSRSWRRLVRRGWGGGDGAGRRRVADRQVVDRLQDLDQVLAAGAGADAASTAGAQHVAELARVDQELVIDALAVARVLIAARIVAAGVQGELARLAGVPVASPGALADALGLVDDVEAVTRGADHGAGAAAVAARTESGPEVVVEVGVEPARRCAACRRSRLRSRAAGRGAGVLGRIRGLGPRLLEVPLVLGGKGAALLADELDDVAVAGRREEHVRTAGRGGPVADGAAEAARRRTRGTPS